MKKKPAGLQPPTLTLAFMAGSKKLTFDSRRLRVNLRADDRPQYNRMMNDRWLREATASVSEFAKSYIYQCCQAFYEAGFEAGEHASRIEIEAILAGDQKVIRQAKKRVAIMVKTREDILNRWRNC